MIRAVFIRHGKTEGNLQHRYIGRTDEPLCDQGVREITQNRKKNCYPAADSVYTSTKRRCRETAALIYPELEPVCLSGFDECDFGEFEGKNYLELSGNEAYQRWIDSDGTLPFPGGEDSEGFKKRCRETFVQVIREFTDCLETEEIHESERVIEDGEQKTIAFVVHGGTIMAIFSAFAEEKKGYFDWQIKNGEGFGAEVCFDEGQPVLRQIEKL